MTPLKHATIRTMGLAPSAEDLGEELAGRLRGVFGPGRIGRISLLCEPKDLADDSTKLLIESTSGSRLAVGHCSPTIAPGKSAHDAERMQAARAALGEELGRCVPEVLWEGEVGGTSCVVQPYFHPFSRSRVLYKMQRLALTPVLFDWLRRVAEKTACDVAPDAELAAALGALSRAEGADAVVKESAAEAAERMASSSWAPRRVLMHGDLWMGNVLCGRPGRVPLSWARPGRFTVIDWGGLRLDGWPFRDLITASASLAAPVRRLAAEVRAHARILGRPPEESRLHLAAALAELGADLGHFSYDRYIGATNSMMGDLDRALRTA